MTDGLIVAADRSSAEGAAEHLHNQLCQGDRDALAGLFDLYNGMVYSIAYRILKDAGEAEDIVQEVFLKVYRSVGTSQSCKGEVRKWIVGIAYNCSLDRWRHLSLRKFYKCDPLDTIPASETSVIMDYCELLATQQSLTAAMALLTDPQKETLRLYFFEGYPLREIAALLPDSFGNVRNHFYRGLARLRSLIVHQGVAEAIRVEAD
jgi:RNA polymerase sigma-70 factor (ECF subfamily)